MTRDECRYVILTTLEELHAAFAREANRRPTEADKAFFFGCAGAVAGRADNADWVAGVARRIEGKLQETAT
jgi:hypothetical protein